MDKLSVARTVGKAASVCCSVRVWPTFAHAALRHSALAPRLCWLSTNSTEVHGSCSRCGKVFSGWTFVCDNCGSLLKVERPSTGCNYFEVLQQPERFDISEKELEATYKGLQKVLHPDRFAQANDEQRSLAEAHSAFLSEAYNSLKNPIPRAKHLMERVHGVSSWNPNETDEEQGDVVDGEGAAWVHNRELLVEVLETNDAIDEANELDEIHMIQKKCDQVTDIALDALGKALSQLNWDEARRQVEVLQMYSRVQNRLKYWEFGDVHKEMLTGQA